MPDYPLVLGVSGIEGGDLSSPISDSLAHLGYNTGNLLFSESLSTVLRGATRSGYHIDPHDLEGRDSIVIAAANWMNQYDDFGFLADACEKTDLPVFLVGLGAQPTEGRAFPTLQPGTERLLRIVSERSESISVRGPFSADALANYGIENVHVTGCPSLLLAGAKPPKVRTPKDFQPASVVMHATRHMYDPANLLQRYLYRQARHQGCDLLIQSELADLLVAAGLDEPNRPGVPMLVVGETYGERDEAIVASYLKAHAKVFYNLPEWRAYMRTRQFCVGSRFHGTIASLLSGTAATLITHDTRTEEMAAIMNIPSVRGENIDRSKDLDLDSFFDPASIQRFYDGYESYKNNFLGFFNQNGLPVQRSLGR